jgi:hypothetical protein
VAVPKSVDDTSVAATAGVPMLIDEAEVDALKAKLLVGAPAVNGKLVRSMETNVVPSNGMIDGLMDETRTGPVIGGTEVYINVAFLSMPTRAE